MASKYFWILGSLIITGLGSIHFFFTFFSNKFSPGNEKLKIDMKNAYPNLTKQTTIWKAWIGFNASHSIGMVFFGLINLYLAVNYFTILQSDNFFFVLTILVIGFYLSLAKKYWFKIPFIGIAITFLSFLISFILTNLNK